MSDRDHIVIIHRWLAPYALYEQYIDHTRHTITYVTTEVGAGAVSPLAAEVTLVDATDDLPSVADRIKQLAEVHGRPTRIIALKEDDLLVAAQLRQNWGCPGLTPEDLLKFRDKFIMASLVAEDGVQVPAFALAPDVAAVQAFGAEHGWPVIIKPRIGSSSAGVSRLDGPDDALALDFESDGPLMVQAFDGRQIYHVDGYFDGTTVGPFRASRYLNTTPLGFRYGDVLGSVEEDDPMLITAIGAFSARAMAALTDGPSMLHLEIFVDRATGDCAFLEVGARVGGGEIPFVWREIHGWDLMEAGFRLSLGLTPQPWPAGIDEPGEVGGFILVPAPASRPCRIVEVTSMLGRVPGPYAEATLSVGDVIPAADAYYEHVGGRFRFRGATGVEVELAIEATARDYRVSAEPIS